LFNLHQAVDVFLGFKNYHNAGACYINLGCLVTKQSMVEYTKAKEYMDAAISLQEQIVHQNFAGEGTPKDMERVGSLDMRPSFEQLRQLSNKNLNNKSQKLTPALLAMEITILAFRHYSRGYISYHFFVQAEEDARYKYKQKEQLLMKYGMEANEARSHIDLSLDGLREIQKNMQEQADFGRKERQSVSSNDQNRTLGGFEDFILF
jgi:hypothetical protein